MRKFHGNIREGLHPPVEMLHLNWSSLDIKRICKPVYCSRINASHAVKRFSPKDDYWTVFVVVMMNLSLIRLVLSHILLAFGQLSIQSCHVYFLSDNLKYKNFPS